MRITTNQLRRNRLWIIAGGSALLVVLLAAGVWRWRQGTALTAQASAPLRFSGEAAVAQLKQDGSYNSLVAAMSAARYQITPDGEQWAAENPVLATGGLGGTRRRVGPADRPDHRVRRSPALAARRGPAPGCPGWRP